jgi:hypothetical protein
MPMQISIDTIRNQTRDLPAFSAVPQSISPPHHKCSRHIQGDQNVSVHLMITVQKTGKNILNSFKHLP